jgi:hypothetical protein
MSHGRIALGRRSSGGLGVCVEAEFMLERKTKKPTEVGFLSERFRCLFGCAGKI